MVLLSKDAHRPTYLAMFVVKHAVGRAFATHNTATEPTMVSSCHHTKDCALAAHALFDVTPWNPVLSRCKHTRGG